jgi:hypothetical protein
MSSEFNKLAKNELANLKGTYEKVRKEIHKLREQEFMLARKIKALETILNMPTSESDLFKEEVEQEEVQESTFTDLLINTLTKYGPSSTMEVFNYLRNENIRINGKDPKRNLAAHLSTLLRRGKLEKITLESGDIKYRVREQKLL